MKHERTVARGVFGLCLVPMLGFSAACYASPAAWVMADLFLLPACLWSLKRKGCSFRRLRFFPAKARG